MFLQFQKYHRKSTKHSPPGDTLDVPNKKRQWRHKRSSYGLKNQSHFRLARVRLHRLPEELIGYYLKDPSYCENNRLLQQPIVLVQQLDEPSPSPSLIDFEDLLPAVDLIETAEIFDSTLRFFQPNMFANDHPDGEPMYLEPNGDVCAAKPAPYRFNASVVHGMATKHLDQMVANMPSPATSFSTELDEEDLDDVLASITAIPDSVGSAAGQE